MLYGNPTRCPPCPSSSSYILVVQKEKGIASRTGLLRESCVSVLDLLLPKLVLVRRVCGKVTDPSEEVAHHHLDSNLVASCPFSILTSHHHHHLLM